MLLRYLLSCSLSRQYNFLLLSIEQLPSSEIQANKLKAKQADHKAIVHIAWISAHLRYWYLPVFRDQ